MGESGEGGKGRTLSYFRLVGDQHTSMPAYFSQGRYVHCRSARTTIRLSLVVATDKP